MNNSETLVNLLQRAEQQERSGAWDEALRLYRQALEQLPGQPEATQGVQRVETKQGLDEAIRQGMAEGDAAWERGHYGEAAERYTQAMNLGGQARILHHHAQLEKKRNEAHDLAAWQGRVEASLRQVEQLQRSDSWPAALTLLEPLLADLPQGPLYEPFSGSLRQARDEIAKQIGDAALLQQAREAFSKDRQDFEEAVRLATAVSEDSSQLHHQAQLLAQSARRQLDLIDPYRQRAEEAINRGEWVTAFTELEQIKELYRNSPIWKQAWLRAGTANLQELLASGRQANMARAFEEAHHHFEQASRVLDSVLAINPSHDQAQSQQLEVKDLLLVAALEEQADRTWKTGDRQSALTTLEKAQEHVEQARADGRDYATVAATISTMSQQLEKELAQIARADSLLAEGDRLFKARYLDRADKVFQQAQEAAFESSQQERAANGRSQVETVKQQFNTALARGEKAADPRDTAAAYQEAYDLWPGGGQVAYLLEEALVQAGKAVLDEGKGEEAILTFNRALKLNPQNRAALLGLDEPNVHARVAAREKSVPEALAELTGRDEVTAEDFTTLLDQVNEEIEKVANYPDLQARLKAVHDQIVDRQKRWTAFSGDYRRAETARDKADWTKAVEQLQKALEALGEEAPQRPRTLLASWTRARTAVQEAQSRGQEGVDKARQAYEQLPETQDATRAFQEARGADSALQMAETAVIEANGPLPEALINLRRVIDDLLRRLEAVGAALGSEDIQGSLDRLDQIILAGEDTTLLALREQYREQLRQQLPKLIEDSNTAWEGGDYVRALELLRQAREAQPGDRTLDERHQLWQRRKQLLDRLRDAEADYLRKVETDSLADAVKGLREALQLAATELPAEGRNILFSLLQTEREFGSDNEKTRAAARQQAQVQLQQLATLGSGDAVIQRIFYLGDLWTTQAYGMALRGFISSRMALGSHQQAYRAAVEYLNLNPSDQVAIDQTTRAAENLLNSTRASAQRRLYRAEEALKEGAFEMTLAELASVETDIYGPVAAEFPDLIRGDEGEGGIEEQRTKASNLERQAQAQKTEDERVRPLLQAAQEAFAHNDLQQASATLEGIIVDPELTPKLAAQVTALDKQIARTRQTRLRQKLDEALNRAQAALSLVVSAADYDWTIEKLESVSNEVNLNELEASDSRRYQQLLTTAKEQREKVIEGAGLWEAGQQAMADEKYETAVGHLEKALAAARDGSQRVTITRLLQQAREKKEQAHRSATALVDAEKAMNQAVLINDLATSRNHYLQARQALDEARRHGVSNEIIEAKLLVIAAGTFWLSGQQAIAEGDFALARIDLEEAQTLLSGREETSGLKRQVRSSLAKLETQQKAREAQAEKEAARHFKLRQAQMKLAQDDPDAAEALVLEVFERASDHPQAEELQKQIALVRQAQKVLQEVEELKDDPAYYNEALAKVEAIRPRLAAEWAIHAAATALHSELTRAVGAGEMLLRIRARIEEGRFDEAEQELTTAREQGADPNELQRLRDLLTKGRDQFEAKTIVPIRNRMREGKYSEALDQAQREARGAKSPDGKRKLEELQAEIADSWVKSEVNEVNQVLREGAQLNIQRLRGLDERLESLVKRDFHPSKTYQDEMQRARLLIAVRQLELRLENVQQQTELTEAWPGTIHELQTLSEEVIERLKAAQKAGNQPVVTRLTRLEFEATDLRISLETRLQAEAAQRDAQLRERGLARARQKLDEATNRRDLEEAASLVNDVLSVVSLQNDREAKALRNTIQQEIRAYDTTRDLLTTSEEQLGQHLYAQADNTLRRLDVVSRLLEEEYQRQSGLVELLLRAERFQDNGEWEEALVCLEAVVAQDKSLSHLVREGLTRSREQLLRRIMDRFDDALQAIPPDIETAAHLLERAESGRMAETTTIERLRRRLESQKQVALAIQILNEEEEEQGDIQAALNALQAARRLAGEEQTTDPALAQWEVLARANLAWRGGRLEEATTYLAQLRHPIVATNKARQLQALTQQQQSTLNEITRLVNEAERLLAAAPPAEQQAARNLRQALQLDPQNRRVQTLVQEQQRVYRQRLEAARQNGMYEEALQLADYLRDLDPDSKEVAALPQWLADERQERLAATIEEAMEVLNRYKPDQAANLINRAWVISAPGGSPVVKRLEQQLAELTEELTRVNPQLEETRQLLRRRDWEQAVSLALQTRQRVPGYKPLEALISELQEQLRQHIVLYLEGDNVVDGLRLVEQGLQLGPEPGLLALRKMLHERRDLLLNQARRDIAQAIDFWQLDEAQLLLGRALRIDETNAVLLQERQRLNLREQAVPDIRNAMVDAWQALGQKQLDSALSSFAWAAAASSEPFAEATDWHGYTRNLQQAITAVETNNFQDAIRLLEAAVGTLSAGLAQRLPTILGGQNRLYQERRQALWDADRLLRVAREMATLQQEITDLEVWADNPDIEQMAQGQILFNKLIPMRRSFQKVYQAHSTPPDDFKLPMAASHTTPLPAPTITPPQEQLPADGRQEAETREMSSQPEVELIVPVVATEEIAEALDATLDAVIVEVPTVTEEWTNVLSNDGWGGEQHEYEPVAPADKEMIAVTDALAEDTPEEATESQPALGTLSTWAWDQPFVSPVEEEVGEVATEVDNKATDDADRAGDMEDAEPIEDEPVTVEPLIKGPTPFVYSDFMGGFAPSPIYDAESEE